MNDVPRRCRLDLMTPAELAITRAIEAVEAAGADHLLTRAVVLLGQARNHVADFVDGKGVLRLRGHPLNTCYVGLLAENGAGGRREVVGGGYARAPFGRVAAGGGDACNIDAIVFPVPTGPWGTVSALCLFAEATGGHGLFIVPQVPRTVTLGDDPPKIAPHGFYISVPNV